LRRSQYRPTPSYGEIIRDIVEELAQRLDGIAPDVIELVDEDLGRLVRNSSGGDG
jgi:hypothetical protein